MDMQERKNEKPLRIAVVMGKHVTGGIKSVLMNYYKNFDRSQVQYDFIVDNDSPDKDYSGITALGGRVFEVFPVRYPVRNMVSCAKIFKREGYLCIHSCINTLNVFPMLAGWAAGVPVRIAENLSTGHPGEKKTIIKQLLKPFCGLFPTHMAANSRYAAVWLYGTKRLSQCRIIKNAIDLKQFRYSSAVRAAKRAELKLEDNFVIGHIGRYCYQKNHDFLIDIFYEVYKLDPSARLLLIGYGGLKEKIFEKINSYGIGGAVIDGGATEEILPFYQAMDCFVLPSLYEGLPVVGIEAQATGLPCVISAEVTREMAVTRCVQFVELEKPAGYWAKVILRWKGYKRQDTGKQLAKQGYDISREAPKLQRYYFHSLKSV